MVLLVVILPLSGVAAEAQIGWNFDTGLSPGRARELFFKHGVSQAPPGSWLRLRGLETWGPASANQGVAPDARADHVRQAREDLIALRSAGFRLVIFERWAPESWPGGTRQQESGHRLAQDLRDAFARCCELAKTFGDLVDYWEIDNEPDLSFVQENPETYAAFLKACYLGIRRGCMENTSFRTKGAGHRRKMFSETEVSGEIGSGSEQMATSKVLMAALGLPPGPYFEAFAHNDGLRYTDGFNYHYYGYAEDFSGMYYECEEAVAESQREYALAWPEGTSASTAVLRTKFFPSADGWHGEVSANFGHSSDAAAEQAKLLLSRPRAFQETAQHASGRWLVTDGITVEEFPGGWRFRVDGWPTGELRAPAAELPLPPSWSAHPESLLSFQYRAIPQEGTRVASSAAPKSEMPDRNAAATAINYRAPIQKADREVATARWPVRELPILLTEYGYGSLDKISRRTPEGRERQAQFFRSVARPIRELGIEGAMAFLLVPYLEVDLQEFGLLIDEESGPPASETKARGSGQWGPYTMSPALQELLTVANSKFPARRWRVITPPPSPIVIDLIAREGIGMAKSYNGYFLEGEHGRSMPGKCELAVYNFGIESVSGALELEGDAWALPNGRRALSLTLAPSERRLVELHVRPLVKQFIACPVAAWFRPGFTGPSEEVVSPAVGGETSSAALGPAPATPLRLASRPPPGAPLHTFEPYFRTRNGNLYETGPRLIPLESWQVYMAQTDNFTPAFFGRLHPPRQFRENQPVSLLFKFHPATLPAVFEVRNAQMVKFSAP